MPEREVTDADYDLAREALLEITTDDTIGEPAGFVDEGEGALTVYFEAEMTGYPGWRWTASIAHVDGAEPTVLEVELMPGEDSLLAPEWVPWVDRLAEQQAAEAAESDAESDDDSDDDDSDNDDDSDDDDDDDESDDDDDESDDDDDDDDDESGDDDDDDDDADVIPVLHSGDLDGVDIDNLDGGTNDDDDDDDDVDDYDTARR